MEKPVSQKGHLLNVIHFSWVLVGLGASNGLVKSATRGGGGPLPSPCNKRIQANPSNSPIPGHDWAFQGALDEYGQFLLLLQQLQHGLLRGLLTHLFVMRSEVCGVGLEWSIHPAKPRLEVSQRRHMSRCPRSPNLRWSILSSTFRNP